MRLTALAVASFAALLTGSGSASGGEPLRPQFSFSFAYHRSSDKKGEIPQFEDFYLVGSFERGLNVVLVSKKGKCSGKTGDRFTEWVGSDASDEDSYEETRTRLIGKVSCPGANNAYKSHMAIIGVDPSEIHVVEPDNDKSLLSKDMESKAWKIASSAYRAEGLPNGANSAPDVFRVGKTVLLLFKSTDDSLNFNGLPVIVFNNNAFELDGTCVWSPFFLSVKQKLYLAYWAMVGLLVYDLSGESPKLVNILP